MVNETTSKSANYGSKSRKERVDLARSRDILDVAEQLGMELERAGRDYRWKEHDSLVITPNKNVWKWFSRDQGGDVIALVETIKEINFNQAIDYLNDGVFKTFDYSGKQEKQEPFRYLMEKYEHPDFEIARNYLKNERGLSDETINFFLTSGKMAEATRKKGDYFEPVIVFKYKDLDGKLVGASLQGIVENRVQHPERGRLKQIIQNSDSMQGFSVDVGNPKRLVFAESSIDLMSYYQANKDHLNDVRLVAMDGLKESTVGFHLAQLQSELSGRPLNWSREQLADGVNIAAQNGFFKDGKRSDMITLAVDNDTAGHNFITNFLKKEIPVQIDIPPILYRNQDKADWNDYLSRPVTPGTNLSHIYSFDGEEYHYQGYYPEELADFKQKELATDERQVLISKEVLTKKELKSQFDNLQISPEKKVQEVQEAGAEYHVSKAQGVTESEENQEQLTEPQLQVVFDFTENKKLSRQYSSGDIIPYKSFISKLYEENELQMIGFKLGYDKTYFALTDEKGNRLINNFRYDIGTEKQDLSEQLAQNLPTPYLELAQEADRSYANQISYGSLTGTIKTLTESVQNKIQRGQLSIHLSDEVYFYTLVNYTGWSYPMQQLRQEALDALKEHRSFFESINETNIERFKEKGTPEQNQMYQLLKGIQKELGRSDTSTIFSEEVAISAYNLNKRLDSLTAENWGKSISEPLNSLGRDTWNILSYPANQIDTPNNDYFYQLVPYHLLEYLEHSTGQTEISVDVYEQILDKLKDRSVEVIPPEKDIAEVGQMEPFSDTQKEHIREFFKTRISDVKTDYIYLPNGQEDIAYYLDGYLFANHYAELDMLSPSKQVDALMNRLVSEDGKKVDHVALGFDIERIDQKFLEENLGYNPDTPIETYRYSEKNIDRVAEKEEQEFRTKFDRRSFAETIGLMQKYSPEEVLNESNSYHDDVRYQSLLIDLGKVNTDPMYRFIEHYINRDIDREALSQFSVQDFITIAQEKGLLNEEPSAKPWKAITVTQPVNSYTVFTDKLSKEFDNVSDLYQFVNKKLKRSQRRELSSLLSESGRGTPLDTLMAIDSAAGGNFNVEVNGQDILSLFPNDINEEATEIYLRSSAEIEETTNVAQAEKEKAPDRGQEQMIDRTNGGTGSLQPEAEGSTSPVLETSTFERSVTSRPTSSYPYLHFTTNYAEVQKRIGNYHPITPVDLKRLNQYAPSIQSTARWYLDELADSKISFIYADKGIENILEVTFQKENFIHLSGIRPFEEGKGAAEFLEDFASGYGSYDGVLISNAIKDKLQVLPMLQDILEPQSFVLDDLTSVEKLHNLNMSEAIKSKDEDFLLLFKDTGNEKIPASLMKLKGELATNVQELTEKTILGIYRERNGQIEQLAINDDYVKDDGKEMLSVLKNRQYEEILERIEPQNEQLPQLENQSLNQELGKDLARRLNVLESVSEDAEMGQEVSTISPKQELKDGLARRVEEITKQNQKEALVASIPELQEKLSRESDLMGSSLTDGGMLYTHQESFGKDYQLELDIHSSTAVESLTEQPAPWSLAVLKENQILGYLAYGSDWGNVFQIEDNLEGLVEQILSEEVSKGLYSQEEVDAFLKENQFGENQQKSQVEEFSSDVPFDYAKASAYELSEIAFQKVREFTQSPEELAHYMDFMSKFPTLSPRNAALVQAQWPGANAVATFNQWKALGETLGISSDDVVQTTNTFTNKRTGNSQEVTKQTLSVKAGEHAQITLFRPVMEEMIPVFDENGKQVINGKGHPKFKKKKEASLEEKQLIAEGKLKVVQFQVRDLETGQGKFTLYKVFELSQTNLKPEAYPKAMPNRHYNFETDKVKTKEVLLGLQDYAQKLGVSISTDEHHVLGNAKGVFYPTEQKILLNPDNSIGEKIGTTIHELAHATLHNFRKGKNDSGLSTGRKELEAEMTSYLVSKHFGLDTSEKAIQYMSHWTNQLKNLNDKELNQSITRIHNTVSCVLKSVEKHTKPYQLNRNRGQNFGSLFPNKGIKI
ncbi:PBECR4 domain-containing protein [Streptococcus intermedius]|uniref:PBECR4 domain-containing protein n=1 Tax=Streptococcus intermedius TaxID=1338 RepID=UPI00025B523A|nr:PBECR4 domain-containing protein [Streptococcus intermedius]EID82439.1 PF13154 family / toprim-like multi-domain protein [Streptococcus intermedius SK54 = ATCC 27335]EPH00177.1 hypothetical protein HMPREF1654_01944 [Streptococcus intermedius SK54 = ATCC 27335]BAM23409.1 hypothetical protein SCIM_0755 [Streptococcus intermedius JTH08]SQH51855.1 putative conjugative transposon membrane protein [Streptococcus intermedius]